MYQQNKSNLKHYRYQGGAIDALNYWLWKKMSENQSFACRDKLRLKEIKIGANPLPILE